MSKAKGTEIEAGAEYLVHMAKPHKNGRRMLSPMHEYVLKGSVLETIPAECIKDFKKVD